MNVLTIICLYSLPKNLKGSLKFRGGDELSSPKGPNKSPVPFPNGNKADPLEDVFPNIVVCIIV